jgi:hypothetical protein
LLVGHYACSKGKESAKEPAMRDLCEYVMEASTACSSGLWTGGESTAYADYVETTIHENQLAEENVPETMSAEPRHRKWHWFKGTDLPVDSSSH